MLVYGLGVGREGPGSCEADCPLPALLGYLELPPTHGWPWDGGAHGIAGRPALSEQQVGSVSGDVPEAFGEGHGRLREWRESLSSERRLRHP